MSEASSEGRTVQGGDTYNAPLIGNGGGVYQPNKTLMYVGGGLGALFLVGLLLKRRKRK